MKRFSLALSFILLSALTLVSCVKKNYDTPPDQTGYDPQIPVTASIAQLKAMPQLKEITEDIVIYGIVIADDRSGNFYKQIVIQDSTGGMTLLLDQNSIYNDYPIGRKIYVKCEGLYLGNYNDLPQLGYTPDDQGSITAIPSLLFDNYIVKANYPNPIVPKEVELSQVSFSNPMLLNTVITIKNVEFDSTQVYKKYADPAPSTGTSRTIKGCDGSSIILRTSGFSKFQPYLTPAGNGTITGIYTVYKGTPQLVIRDTSDVKFYGTRCNGQVVNPPPPPVITRIKDVRNMFTGSTVSLGSISITGVVINDKNSNSTSGKLLVIQDGDRGITLFFGDNHNFLPGDSLVINVSGGSLQEYNNLLQIQGLSASSAEKVGTGVVTPKTITIAQLLADFENNESSLVKILNVSIPAGGKYVVGGQHTSKDITDGTGSMKLFSSGSASFGANDVPTTPKTFIGVVGQNNASLQLQIRSLNDVL